MIKLFKPFMAQNINLQETFDSGMIGQGPKVDEFENKLQTFIGNPNLCVVNSGTSALHLAYFLSGKFTKFLVSPLTCIATVSAIYQLPYPFPKFEWVDIDPETLNVDPEELKKDKFSDPETSLIAVHWGGNPVDFYTIKRNFSGKIIEDCAHAFGAFYDGKKLGNHENVCCFSFQAVKHLTTGDGGAIVVPDEETRERIKKLRWYGFDRKERTKQPSEVGFKYHMNDIAATIGLANFDHIDFILEKHRENSIFYDTELAKVDGIVPLVKNIGSSCWLYTIKVDRKEDFEQVMLERGVETGLHHHRLDKLDVFSYYSVNANLPKLDSVYNKLTNIPVGWWVSKENRQYIVDCIKKGW